VSCRCAKSASNSFGVRYRRTVRANSVVIGAPAFELSSCIGQAQEPVRIQTLIAKDNRIRRRVDKASGGPWRSRTNEGRDYWITPRRRTDIPDLLKEIARLRWYLQTIVTCCHNARPESYDPGAFPGNRKNGFDSCVHNLTRHACRRPATSMNPSRPRHCALPDS